VGPGLQHFLDGFFVGKTGVVGPDREFHQDTNYSHSGASLFRLVREPGGFAPL
jgi:hypothetical protein